MTIPANLSAPALNTEIPIGAYVEFQLASSQNLAGAWTVFGSSNSYSIPFTCSTYSPTTLSTYETGPTFVTSGGWSVGTQFPTKGTFLIEVYTVEASASTRYLSRTTSQVESMTYLTVNARIGISNGSAQGTTALNTNDGDVNIAYNRTSTTLTVYWCGYRREGAGNWRCRITRTG